MVSLSLNPTCLRRVWSISWPTVIYSLLETTVGMVDIYLAGYIGTEAVAALGFANQIFLVLMIGTLSITTGTITLVAQYYGARQYDRASAVALQSVLISAASGIGIGALGCAFSRLLLVLMGAAQDVIEPGTQYLQIIMAGVVFMMLSYSTNAVFRALGDSLTPLRISLLTNFLNVLISVALMFGFWRVPALGVRGIALGTVLARAAGALISLLLLCEPKRSVHLYRKWVFEKETLLGILRIGLPSGFSGFFRNGARILFFAIIASAAAGTEAVAAAAIGFQIRLVSIMPALAFQVAAAALVGQSLGAGKVEEAEELGWTAIRLCTGIMAVTSLLVFSFPHTLLSLFTDSPEVLAFSGVTLRAVALEQFCNCVSIVVSGVLYGAGDTSAFMRYTIASQWALMLPLAYGLSLSRFGIYGAWLAWGLSPAVQMALTWKRYASGRWKELRVMAPE